MLKLFALALTLLAGAAHADSTLHTDLPLAYLEQTQSDARNQPLVIFLHGFGSNEDDLFGIKDALPSTWTYLSVRAPMPVDPHGYRFVEADCPERVRGDIDYTTAVQDLNRDKQQTFERMINEEMADGEVAQEIERVRKAARLANGWIMDTYLLRKP